MTAGFQLPLPMGLVGDQGYTGGRPVFSVVLRLQHKHALRMASE